MQWRDVRGLISLTHTWRTAGPPFRTPRWNWMFFYSLSIPPSARPPPPPPPSGRSNGLRKATGTGPSLRRAALQTDRCPLKSCDRGGGGVGGGTGNSIRRRRRRRRRRPRRRDACSMIGARSLGWSVGRSPLRFTSVQGYVISTVCDVDLVQPFFTLLFNV